jgi:hypothetical protein
MAETRVRIPVAVLRLAPVSGAFRVYGGAWVNGWVNVQDALGPVSMIGGASSNAFRQGLTHLLASGVL